MKMDDRTAHVCLHRDEAQVGDEVTVFRNVCSRQQPPYSKGTGTVRCQKKEIGSGTITSFLNEHYSEARFSAGTDFKEGDMVERTK